MIPASNALVFRPLPVTKSPHPLDQTSLAQIGWSSSRLTTVSFHPALALCPAMALSASVRLLPVWSVATLTPWPLDVSIVLVIGKFLRLSVDQVSHRIIFEDMPQAGLA